MEQVLVVKREKEQKEMAEAIKKQLENEERNHVWEVAKRVATEKEYKTLQAMSTDGLTRKEIAEIVGVSESALCGLRNRVFNKIRKNL